jgi:hypothetical protein
LATESQQRIRVLECRLMNRSSAPDISRDYLNPFICHPFIIGTFKTTI